MLPFLLTCSGCSGWHWVNPNLKKTNSQGMKNCKSTESFCLSMLTIYTMIGPLLTCLLLPCLYFFSEISKYVQAKSNILSPLTGWPTWIGILWKRANMLTALVCVGEYRLGWFFAIRHFPANKIYHFSRLSHQAGCLFTWAARSI